jgi:competence protein ComEC
LSETPGRWPAALKCLLPFASGISAAGFLTGETRFLQGDVSRVQAAALASLVVLIAAALVPGRSAHRGPRFRSSAKDLSFALLLFASGFLRLALPAAAPLPAAFRASVAERDTVSVRGLAERVERRSGGTWRVLLRLEEMTRRDENLKTGASVTVTWPDSIPPPLEGSRVAIRTVIQPIKGATNPGEWDGRRHALRHGVDARAVLRRPADLLERDPPPFVSSGRALHGLRAAMGEAIDRRLDGFPRRFARVLLMGDRVAFQPAEEADFRRAGVTHILSVSGLHVGLVAATVQILLGRRRRPAGLAVALSATWGYTLLVGAPAAAVRSAAMLTLVMVARHRRRVLSGAPLLSGASFVLLLAAPLLLFDLGFLLSVLSVAGLLVGHRLLSSLPALESAPRPLRIAAETFGMTFAAQAATAPVTIALWGDWPLVAPVANLLVVGLSDFVLMAGLLALVLGLLHPAASDGVFAVTWALSRVVGFSVHQLAVHSPGITGLTAPPGWVPSAYVLLAAGAVMAVISGRRRAAIGLALGWIVAFALLVASPRRSPAGLRVTILDIGQGDASLIEFPDGRSILIDGGEGGDRDTGGRVVLPALRSARLSRLDAMVVSHAHHDHQGGLLKVLAGTRVGKVFETGFGPETGEPAQFRELALSRGAPICLVARGDTLLSGVDYLVTALWPPRPPDPADDYERAGSELNDLSLVLLVTWRGHRLVFPGDLEGAAEAELVGMTAADRIDFLKAGHHGSRTSSTAEWLEILSPKVASVSVGDHNKFRHPSREVMARYASLGVAVHRTDRGGALRLTWLPQGIGYERWGDGLSRAFRKGVVPEGGAWPAEFLDASATIW